MTAQNTVEDEVRDQLRELFVKHPDPVADPFAFRGTQFDLGLAWVHFPVGLGGLGASRGLQAVVDHAVVQAGGQLTWDLNPIGYGMAGPTIMTHASPELAGRLLRPLFTVEERWCQLFSEPGSGSDVAGASTRAVRDGDEWVVDGQKVWSSLAHLARWGLLLARTAPEQPKHLGLSYFVLDMQAPGVEVRPLRQMTGDAEFNEVYLTNARVPDSARLGPEGGGWRVAITTLMNERVAIGGSASPRGTGPISLALRIWKESAGARSPVLRDRLAQLWIEAETLRLTNARAGAAKSGEPGPEGSIAKLASAEFNKRVYNFCIDVLGPSALVGIDYTMGDRSNHQRVESDQLDPLQAFLRARANTIEGGTSEIMRNILGERVLGLPKEPRSDSDRPWTEVPRN